jgi:hypothetical protein
MRDDVLVHTTEDGIALGINIRSIIARLVSHSGRARHTFVAAYSLIGTAENRRARCAGARRDVAGSSMRPRRTVCADMILDMLVFFANADITRCVVTRRDIAGGII